MNNESTATVESPGLSREEIKRHTARSLAADIIERGLNSRFFEMYISMLQIADSGLIDRDEYLQGHLEELCKEGERLDTLIHDVFPACNQGGAEKLMDRTCRTLVDEISYFRQEAFWTGKDSASFIRSEELIRDLFKFYTRAEELMIQIDELQVLFGHVHRKGRAPQLPANHYREIGIA
jgi:hypothetical protein